jgi:predicted DNA-binding protein (MmcQ/YjbR family)
MNIEWFRDHCLSFPHTTEQVQWVRNLVFKIGGKMFAVAALEPGAHVFSFKCTPSNYAELIEYPGILPAPYMARAQWVAFERSDVLPRAETKRLVGESYDLVFAKLPKKTQSELR